MPCQSVHFELFSAHLVAMVLVFVPNLLAMLAGAEPTDEDDENPLLQLIPRFH